MVYKKVRPLFFLWIWLCVFPDIGWSQQLSNVPEAFKALPSEPEVIRLNNTLVVPTDNGHFQGVQAIVKNGTEKLLISGSSQTTAYVLQADLATRKTDILIHLMTEPFRHAGGIQASSPYMVVGMEDNIQKTVSKVGLYDYVGDHFLKAEPNLIIERQGKVERYTAGATGLLPKDDGYLVVVGNWDSRDWDFYLVNPMTGKQEALASFSAPDDWPGYQSINLIRDNSGIYAIGTYQKGKLGYADLIWVSDLVAFAPVPKIMGTKAFHCSDKVDFNGAAGVQVDADGKLHLWATQKNADRDIFVNRFSQP